MQLYLDCYPCFLRQALSAARFAGGTEAQQRAVLHAVLAQLGRLEPDLTPPEIAWRVHRVVQDTIAVGDPYAAIKTESTRQALALYPRLRALVASSDDPLGTALRVSIAGNSIDMGVRDDIADLWAAVERVLAQPCGIDCSQVLRTRLAQVDEVLFLADNAGETVCDRVLIETLPVPAVYVVKERPVLNDATVADACAAGLDACATILSNGSDAPGTLRARCSAAFRALLDRAALIIAKGQANYESLSTAGARVFCLLQVKCPVIAADIGAPVGSPVIWQAA